MGLPWMLASLLYCLSDIMSALNSNVILCHSVIHEVSLNASNYLSNATHYTTMSVHFLIQNCSHPSWEALTDFCPRLQSAHGSCKSFKVTSECGLKGPTATVL